MATKENAAAALTALFESYGLGSLGPKIVELVQQYGPDNTDQITLALRETEEYKERFKANEARQRAGLPTLSPAEYIAQETQYRQVLRAAGLPAGFYDTQDDFHRFLERDVSPTELSRRASAAVNLALAVDPVQRETLAEYGIDVGHLAAYFLDLDRASASLEADYQKGLLAAERKRAGRLVDDAFASELQAAGVGVEQARAGYERVGESLDTLEKLGEVYGEGFSFQEAERAELLGDSTSRKKARRLASKERANFSGRAGNTSGSLARDDTFK